MCKAGFGSARLRFVSFVRGGPPCRVSLGHARGYGVLPGGAPTLVLCTTALGKLLPPRQRGGRRHRHCVDDGEPQLFACLSNLPSPYSYGGPSEQELTQVPLIGYHHSKPPQMLLGERHIPGAELSVRTYVAGYYFKFPNPA